jgi:uncharacterized protein with GYD domain
MATFVSLINWTDQGVRNFKDSPKRADAFDELVQRHGGTLKDIYWTLGEYDIVTVVDTPDEETFTAIALELAALGNVRTSTMRAFNRKDMARIIKKTG